MDKTEVEYKSKELYNYMLNQLADKFNKERTKKQLSIRELNKLSGVSTAVISDMENKIYMPKTDGIIRMSLALDIPLEDVLSAMLPPNTALTKNNNKPSEILNILTGLGLDKKEKDEVLAYLGYIMFRRKHKANSSDTTAWNIFQNLRGAVGFNQNIKK